MSVSHTLTPSHHTSYRMCLQNEKDQPIMMVAMPTQGEESATVGVSVAALSSSPVGGEGEVLGAIPEEALEVGTEKGIACKYV